MKAGIVVLVVGVLCATLSEAAPVTCLYNPAIPVQYTLLAVSGTLQDGFELRANMDWWPNRPSNVGRVNGTFLGNVLVRGYKAFLDIKNPSYREYKDDGILESDTVANNGFPLKTINPALVPTFCDDHANQYALYLVDSRQVVRALAGEPRFLSIAPDNGLADLVSSYTSARVKAYANRRIILDAANGRIATPANFDRIAFLTVTSTIFKNSFIPSPAIGVEYGTVITDYPQSVGLWSGCGSDPTLPSPLAYSQCIDAAIRREEALPPAKEQQNNNLAQYTCPNHIARYGVTKYMSRFNGGFTGTAAGSSAADWEQFASDAGFPLPVQGCSLPV